MAHQQNQGVTAPAVTPFCFWLRLIAQPAERVAVYHLVVSAEIDDLMSHRTEPVDQFLLQSEPAGSVAIPTRMLSPPGGRSFFPPHFAGFSMCPPNWKRIADKSLSWKSASPRELNRA